MSAEDYSRFSELKVFIHQIYEYKKGVRRLVLCTMSHDCATVLVERLRCEQIRYTVQYVSNSTANVYFGDPYCLETVETFIHKPLNKLTPEEDFMLGVMLGYDISMQCDRFCQRKKAYHSISTCCAVTA